MSNKGIATLIFPKPLDSTKGFQIEDELKKISNEIKIVRWGAWHCEIEIENEHRYVIDNTLETVLNTFKPQISEFNSFVLIPAGKINWKK